MHLQSEVLFYRTT